MRPGLVISGDLVAVGGIVLSLAGYLPPLAAIVAIVWYIIQIFESRTLQTILNRQRLRKLVLLRARAASLELLIRGTHSSVRELNEANVIHAAAIQKRQDIFDPHKEGNHSQ